MQKQNTAVLLTRVHAMEAKVAEWAGDQAQREKMQNAADSVRSWLVLHLRSREVEIPPALQPFVEYLKTETRP